MTFPRMNLPSEAVPWARAREEFAIDTRNQVDSMGQSVSGQNRATTSSLQDLAASLERQQEQLERIQELNDAIPIPTNRFVSRGNFTVPTTGWTTLISFQDLPPKSGILSFGVTASAQLRNTSTGLVQVNYRTIVDGLTSPVVAGVESSPPGGGWRNTVTFAFGGQLNVSESIGVNVQFQVQVAEAVWGDSAFNSASVIFQGTYVR